MITYNDIYEASRKERYSDQLQKLPKNFIVQFSQYLKEKKEIASKDDDVFSDVLIKTKKQLENAITLFRELMRMRRKKILNLVLVAAETGISKQDFAHMLDFEKELFEDIMKCVEISDKKLNAHLNGNELINDYENDLVVFLDCVEEFVGLDGEVIGPFEKGQIANLPKKIVSILVESKKVEILEK